MKSELMREQAVLLTGDRLSIDDGRARRLLEFFGVPYEMQNATDFRLPNSPQAQSNTKGRLSLRSRDLCSFDGKAAKHIRWQARIRADSALCLLCIPRITQPVLQRS